ncbi:GNAT family N-acetyltransferase [Cellulophaga sp. 20_2_10]|uniref:GNAT family N-acetyltransferase n=1 Tax=Cellulophaga sp. 20_2_10 TaxID=2942476 RepID=UPI00201A39E8|nr:GNAT family N-acetyltransferase [Cellulophaga sp. 20_2_10]MCL5244806.1 GNAT family N-acetyltransferase [Cellulophaga sp. 20_2_10]
MLNNLEPHTKFSFFLDLFFKDKTFPWFYNKITNNYLKTVVYNSDHTLHKTATIETCIVYDIPNYLDIKTTIQEADLKEIRFPLYNGYAVYFGNHATCDAFLHDQVGKSRTNKLRRHQNRLDLSIAPTYTMYYGAIEEIEYKRLFKELKRITALRFTQKEESNFELPYLNYYEEIMFKMILTKKASIYVIYDKDKPINITLNFIDGQTMLHFNSCFDVDYSMYNLGHLNTIKHLRWCYDNNIKLFDMGRGDFFHKRQWINKTYLYQEHIIYNSKSVTATLKAKKTIAFYKLRFKMVAVLKKMKFHLIYGKYIKYKYRLFNKKDTKNNHIYTLSTGVAIPKDANIVQINYLDEEYNNLLFYVNDFLHKNFEKNSAICVYKDTKLANTYYIKGEKNTQKIRIKSS